MGHLTHPFIPFCSWNSVGTRFCSTGAASAFPMLPQSVQSRSLLFQDADCIFLNKEELEVKVDLLRRQLELLKCVFEEVSSSAPSQCWVLPHPWVLHLEIPLGPVLSQTLNT